MNASCPSTIDRCLAVDLHKHYVVVGGVDKQQAIVLPPRRVGLDAWPAWAKHNLCPTDTLVIEATTNAWDFYDQVRPLVKQVIVANAGKVKLIAATRVKTDKLDVLTLARLLAAGLIAEVWVPPLEVRELRSLVAHRRQLVKSRTRLKNHLHSLLHRHHLLPPEGNPFVESKQPWWDALSISPSERLQLRHDMSLLLQLALQIDEVEAEFRRLSTAPPWADLVTYLLQLPGFGLITTLTLLAAIGDITRFDSPKKLVGYAGLGASVHDSGLTHRSGRITKSGRREMRWALVEAAWIAVDKFPYWKQLYQRLTSHMIANKAIVAIARHLLVAVWHVLTDRTADKYADPHRVAFKLMAWSWKLNDHQRAGLTQRQFIRYHLMRLRLGDDLTQVVRGRMKRLVASPEEVLALRPELGPAH